MLKSVAVGAVGLGGLATAGSGSVSAQELADNIVVHGDQDPVAIAETLLRYEGYDGVETDDCWWETKCYDGCSGNGKLARKYCCDGFGCGEWEYTDICC